MLIGLRQGFETGLQFGQIPVFTGSSECGTYTSGEALAPWLGAGISFPELIADHLGLSLQLGWTFSYGTYSTVPTDELRVLDATTNSLITLDRHYLMKSFFQMIRLELLLQGLVSRNLSMRGGISVGYRFNGSFDVVDQIDGAGGYRFPGGELERSISGSQQLTLSSMSLAALVSGVYKISLGNSILLEPELSLRYDMLSPVREWRWQTISIGANLGLSFDLFHKTIPKVLSEIAIPVPVLKPSPITASIEIYSINENSNPQRAAKVVMHDRIERRLVPLLPLVRFDRGSAEISSWYVRRSPHEAKIFTIDSLTEENAFGIQRNLLDVLGLRLRDHPSAHLQLYSPVIANQSALLSTQRAEAVRNYFIETWGIRPDRLEISERVFNQRGNTEDKDVVEMASNVPDITFPVETARLLQMVAPPAIRLKPEYHAASGVKRWQVTVSHEGKQLAQYSSDTNNAASASSGAWTIPHRRSDGDTTLEPIVAELVVEDSSGAVATARDRMPLIIERTDESAVEELVCLLFPFIPSSQTLTEELSSQLRTLVPMIRSGAHINIQSFAQAVEERSDAGLAERRAVMAKNALQAALSERSLHNVIIDVVNSNSTVSQEMFEPALQRRVEITVKQSASTDK